MEEVEITMDNTYLVEAQQFSTERRRQERRHQPRTNDGPTRDRREPGGKVIELIRRSGSSPVELPRDEVRRGNAVAGFFVWMIAAGALIASVLAVSGVGASAGYWLGPLGAILAGTIGAARWYGFSVADDREIWGD